MLHPFIGVQPNKSSHPQSISTLLSYFQTTAPPSLKMVGSKEDVYCTVSVTISRHSITISPYPLTIFPCSLTISQSRQHADLARLLVGDERLVRRWYVMQDNCYLRNDLTENRRRRACAFPKRQRYQEEAGRSHYFRHPTICYYRRTKGTAQQSQLKDLELTPPSHCMTMLYP